MPYFKLCFCLLSKYSIKHYIDLILCNVFDKNGSNKTSLQVTFRATFIEYLYFNVSMYKREFLYKYLDFFTLQTVKIF